MPGGMVEIDLGALAHNFGQVRKLVDPAAILAVVKSDAYGHGMVQVARQLEILGVDWLGVSTCREALELRQQGIKSPILVLLGVEPGEFSTVIRHHLTPVLFREDIARGLGAAARQRGAEVAVHIKIDTGMSRLGVPHERARKFFAMISSVQGLRVEGLLSHFAAADEYDKSFSAVQLERFQRTLEVAREVGLPFRYAHMANSAGIIDLPEAYLQLVRPGLMLYGALPSRELHRPVSLKPVMSLKTRILQLREVSAQSPIGYGCTHYTSRPSRIATLPVGYDDGYSRLLSNRGEVLVGGRRALVVGRISMCLTTVDVTDIPEVEVDDEVVLLGAQGEERITADEIAAKIGTIAYEVFCNLGGNRPKHFFNAVET